jgi:hypothetical protein
MHCNQKGDISLASVIDSLVRRNISVSLPFTDNKRYDLIADIYGGLYRVQVKTASLDRNGDYLSFRTCSFRMTTKGNVYKSYTSEEVDLFLAYCIKLNKVYLAWMDEVPATQIFLRLKETKNQQKKAVRWAKDYELDIKLRELMNLSITKKRPHSLL